MEINRRTDQASAIEAQDVLDARLDTIRDAAMDAERHHSVLMRARQLFVEISEERRHLQQVRQEYAKWVHKTTAMVNDQEGMQKAMLAETYSTIAAQLIDSILALRTELTPELLRNEEPEEDPPL